MNIIILVLLSILLFLRLNKILAKNFAGLQEDYSILKNEYDRLNQDNKKLEEENLILETVASETIALYDITKEISKYLEENKLFSCFKEQLTKYISFTDCRFLKEETELGEDTDYLVLPIRIKITSDPVGYLVVKGIKEGEVDKFHILANQFILGLKRAYLYRQVQELAITDSLTGLFSRRYFLERFNEELERSQNFNHNLSFLMVDIDYFKEYNDRFGHLVGDTILKGLSKIIKDNIRQIDFLGRYGGEEFSIILPETDKKEAFFVAERIREAIETNNIRAYDEDLKITISIGISTFPADAKIPERLIEKADEALYRAKNTGRNRTCT